VPRTLIDDSVGWASLSPDGEQVAHVDRLRNCPSGEEGPFNCYYRLFTIPWDGGPERQRLPDDQWAAYPAWAPDGDHIVYTNRDVEMGIG
jgi:Tol biopolymer transport system component